jgi:methionyl-tRNA formyltransferase
MKDDLRIVFMGTPEFAVASLDALIREKFYIAGIITAPDKPAGRGQKIVESSVKKYALKTGFSTISPILQPVNLKDPSFLEELRTLKPDLQVVVAFRMLPESVWSLPGKGTINLHASLLPQYRGAAPINHVIMNGETETGVTTFFIRHEIDTGNILLQERVKIGSEETAGELHDRLMKIGAELVVKTVRSIKDANYKEIRQSQLTDKFLELKSAPKIGTEDCRINWDRPAQGIYNFIRGLSPYPAAWSEWTLKDNRKITIKIYRSIPEFNSVPDTEPQNYKPGILLTDNKRYLKAVCSDGFISITDIQLAGKKRMGIEEFLRGNRDIRELAISFQ